MYNNLMLISEAHSRQKIDGMLTAAGWLVQNRAALNHYAGWGVAVLQAAFEGAAMNFDSQNHRRRSIRMQGYDYTQAGAYFVTICTWQRECLFGEVTAI